MDNANAGIGRTPALAAGTLPDSAQFSPGPTSLFLFVPADLPNQLYYHSSSAETRRGASLRQLLWIRGYVVLHLQFVEHVEIGVQVVIAVQRL